MSRAQKHHSRPRHLYALLFANRHCYVGQSVDLKRRSREHKRDWPDDFEMIHLGTMQGSQAQAEEYEYAWRWKAHKAGWRNYGKQSRTGSVFLIRDPRLRMEARHYGIARNLKWPVTGSTSNEWKRPVIAVLICVLLLTILGFVVR